MRGITWSHQTKTLPRRILAIALLCGMVASLTGSPVMGQDDGVADEPVVTEAPPPLPTEPPPPPPTEPPPPPTAVPTEPPPPPTAVPTDLPVMPTEVPATEIPATGVPTEEPTPTPTATPDSTLTWSLAAEPECRLAEGEATTVASGDGQVYTCTSTVDLTGTQVIPAAVGLDWFAKATVDAGWAVQILRPKQVATDTVEWTESRLGETTFAFDQRDPLGTDTEATDLDRTVTVSWAVRVIRPACNLDEPALRLTHGIAVTAPGATVEADPTMKPNPDPLRVEPALAPVPDPAVAFAGSLDFGEVGATANGLTETVRTGTLTLNLTGLDTACGDWDLALSATTLVDANGSPLDGSTLVVTAVDGVALAGGACDLTGGCSVATLTTGPDTSPNRTITVTVELRMPETAAPGAFGTTIDAALQPTGASTATDSPTAMRE